jgi:hypothetical protein
MSLAAAALAIALAAAQLPPAPPQTQPPPAQERTPDFRVQVWGDAGVDFDLRMRSYAGLRGQLERGLPPLRSTDDAKEILARVNALAKRIRAARSHAREGDIFGSAIAVEFKKALGVQTDPITCVALFDDNPGAIGIKINGTYPEHKPLSTMPANVLAVLPRLPEDIEYRFAGRHLLLFDTRARVLIDRMPSAIQCSGS